MRSWYECAIEKAFCSHTRDFGSPVRQHYYSTPETIFKCGSDLCWQVLVILVRRQAVHTQNKLWRSLHHLLQIPFCCYSTRHALSDSKRTFVRKQVMLQWETNDVYIWAGKVTKRWEGKHFLECKTTKSKRNLPTSPQSITFHVVYFSFVCICLIWLLKYMPTTTTSYLSGYISKGGRWFESGYSVFEWVSLGSLCHRWSYGPETSSWLETLMLQQAAD